MRFKVNSIKVFIASSLLLATMAMQAQALPFHFFDQRKLMDVQGRVLAIEFEDIYGKKSSFLMLSIQSEDQRLFRVEVCPQWFFATDIAVGMKVLIHGSLIEDSSAGFYLIAQEISLQGERITLRDGRGFPLWSRSGGRHGNQKGPGNRGKK